MAKGKMWCDCPLNKKYLWWFTTAQPIGYPNISVHSQCFKPHEAFYRSKLKHCIECLALFSAPDERICVSCFKEQKQSRAYIGWRWLTKEITNYYD